MSDLVGNPEDRISHDKADSDLILFLAGLEETKKESKKLKYSVEVQHVVSYWFL